MGARILNVTKMANVSTATVSRVISGTGSIKKEPRKKVLDEISVVGFDNIQFVSTYEPGITSNAEPAYKTGEMAMDY